MQEINISQQAKFQKNVLFQPYFEQQPEHNVISPNECFMGQMESGANVLVLDPQPN